MYVYIGEVAVVKGDDSQRVFSWVHIWSPKKWTKKLSIIFSIWRFLSLILVVEFLMPKNLQMLVKFELSIWRTVFRVIPLEIWRTCKQVLRFFSLYNIWVSQHTYHTIQNRPLFSGRLFLLYIRDVTVGKTEVLPSFLIKLAAPLNYQRVSPGQFVFIWACLRKFLGYAPALYIICNM